MNITDYIPNGRKNAVNAKTLSCQTGLDIRTVRYMIQKARKNGIPICASETDPKGYYLADTEDERQAYIFKLNHRIREMYKTLYGIIHGTDDNDDYEQLSFF